MKNSNKKLNFRILILLELNNHLFCSQSFLFVDCIWFLFVISLIVVINQSICDYFFFFQLIHIIRNIFVTFLFKRGPKWIAHRYRKHLAKLVETIRCYIFYFFWVFVFATLKKINFKSYISLVYKRNLNLKITFLMVSTIIEAI